MSRTFKKFSQLAFFNATQLPTPLPTPTPTPTPTPGCPQMLNAVDVFVPKPTPYPSFQGANILIQYEEGADDGRHVR
jgi:hypothetical protein